MAIFSGTITAGGSDQSLVPSNPIRKRLYFQNQSVGDLYIEEGGSAGLTSLRVGAGASVTLEQSDDPTSAWRVYGATTGQAFYARDK